jgi:hypothetical protein
MSPNELVPALPFAVILRVFHKSGHKTCIKWQNELMDFVTDEKAAVVDRTYIKEEQSVRIAFQARDGRDCPDDARLYLDGLDQTDAAIYDHDTGAFYLEPGEYVLYEYDSGLLPWIPGNYRVLVRWGGTNYYTILQVRPSHLSYTGLRLLREELEEAIRGLTFSILRRNRGLGKSQYLPSIPQRVYQFLTLERCFPQLLAVLHDLNVHLRFEVTRRHAVVPFHKVRQLDARSHRWLQSAQGMAKNVSFTNGPGYILAPINEITHSMPENYWIAYYIKYFMQILTDVIQYANSYAAYLNAQATESLRFGNFDVSTELAKKVVDEYAVRARRMHSQLYRFLASSTLSGLKTDRYISPTIGLFRDSRYVFVHSLYQQLTAHKEKILVDPDFQYQWKHTALLYEYWVFIKILKVLTEELGFTPQTGWLFDSLYMVSKTLVPNLNPGSAIQLQRDDTILRVVYDEAILRSEDEARRAGYPVWTPKPHNRPDVRIDIYRQQADSEHFEATIPIDAKYRRAQNIWYLEPDRFTPIHRQLEDYASIAQVGYGRKLVAVRGVLCLYPRDPERAVLLNDASGYIWFLQLDPTLDTEPLARLLNKLIFNDNSEVWK